MTMYGNNQGIRYKKLLLLDVEKWKISVTRHKI